MEEFPQEKNKQEATRIRQEINHQLFGDFDVDNITTGFKFEERYVDPPQIKNLKEEIEQIFPRTSQYDFYHTMPWEELRTHLIEFYSGKPEENIVKQFIDGEDKKIAELKKKKEESRKSESLIERSYGSGLFEYTSIDRLFA